ncbi:hypothetical protein F751_6922 [Auxenochlorella protothecoides]|uniref:Uncharacterized protein n=1 Tax=Auxenochlorella protothecoides TaxID=3075 RepID=A0A087SE00_AUXPR|nr:hypothetical protein F751_6922 [Auxenochlorella protothecoides]KFM23954.1 hypothetical protein F751_6922 [Auxenochlorella protothecoides]
MAALAACALLGWWRNLHLSDEAIVGPCRKEFKVLALQRLAVATSLNGSKVHWRHPPRLRSLWLVPLITDARATSMRTRSLHLVSEEDLRGLPEVCPDLVSLSLQDADVTPPPSLARLPFQHTVAIDDPLLCLFGLADLPHLRSLTLGVLWVGTPSPHPGAACAFAWVAPDDVPETHVGLRLLACVRERRSCWNVLPSCCVVHIEAELWHQLAAMPEAQLSSDEVEGAQEWSSLEWRNDHLKHYYHCLEEAQPLIG